MKSQHRFFFKDSRAMTDIDEGTVHLVVTSPPYPMIDMWDDMFALQSKTVAKALKKGERMAAYEGMHRELDAVWDEVIRVLCPGGFACINIGDATRTIEGHFMLYPNHARILAYLIQKGMTPLPEIIWRKQSNAPNKFMGSGMLPAGAYVTQEHEYVLILRKGGKREFKTEDEKQERQESAFFWEERNQWFSDVWFDLLGTRQKMLDKEVRKRSGAYPFELPYRLITMYSQKGDTVLDPFFGIGTTMLAAMAAGRDSVGYELSDEFKPVIIQRAKTLIDEAKNRINERLDRHHQFVEERLESGKPFKHRNAHYHFPVITAQEKHLLINEPLSVSQTDDQAFEVTYATEAQTHVAKAWKDFILPNPGEKVKARKPKQKKQKTSVQMELF